MRSSPLHARECVHDCAALFGTNRSARVYAPLRTSTRVSTEFYAHLRVSTRNGNTSTRPLSNACHSYTPQPVLSGNDADRVREPA
jgi:hypothetical protein